MRRRGGGSGGGASEEGNLPPTAIAGTKIDAVIGQAITLNGGGSNDPENQTLTFEWALVSKPANSTAYFDGAQTATPTLSNIKAGSYVAQLIVNDGVQDSSPSTVTIDVAATSTNPPAASTLQALYGRLTLNYQFNPSSTGTVFTDSVDFTASSLDSTGTKLYGQIVGKTSRFIGCALNTVAGFNYAYVCILLDYSFNTTELFAFNISGKQISSGIYEYCSSGTSLETCSTSLLVDADGIIITSSGILAESRSAALSQNRGQEQEILKSALDSEGAISRTNISIQHPTQQLFEELLEKLPTNFERKIEEVK